MAWFCTPPLHILEKPRSPCQPPKVRFCTVHISAQKNEGFRFCTGAIWGPQRMMSNHRLPWKTGLFFATKCDLVLRYTVCGGSGPLLESCRPQLRAPLYTHRVLKKWFLYQMKLTMSIWNDLAVYKMLCPTPRCNLCTKWGLLIWR